MSVTFMPSGNMDYCTANGLVEKTTYDCQCLDFPEHNTPDRPCRDCDGKGKVEFDRYPFELNVANGNALELLGALGVEKELWGSCEPQAVIDGVAFVRSLQNCGCEPLETPARTEGNLIEMGRSVGQIDHYLGSMIRIANEAARRKVLVTWG